MEAGSAAWIRVDGKLLVDQFDWRGGDGLYLAAIKDGNSVLMKVFRTGNSESEADSFSSAVEALAEDTMVLLAVKGEATGQFHARAQRAIESIGGQIGLLKKPSGSSYLCIGMKGLPPGQAIERIGRDRQEYPSPLHFGSSDRPETRRAALVTVTVKAEDVSGNPVPNAVVFAWCPTQGLHAPCRDIPACRTDRNGIGKFCVSTGEWVLLAGGRTVGKHANCLWTVCKSKVSMTEGAATIVLKAERALPVAFEGFPQSAIPSAEIVAVPTSLSPYWSPGMVGYSDGREIEIASDTPLSLWFNAPTNEKAPYAYLLRSEYTAGSHRVIWNAGAASNARIALRPTEEEVSCSRHRFLIIEHFGLSVFPRREYTYVGALEKMLIISPGPVSFRWGWQWGTGPDMYWDAEVSAGNPTLRAGELRNLPVSHGIRVVPLVDRISNRHLDYWLDAVDGLGRRVDWIGASGGRPLAKITVSDKGGKIAAELEARHSTQFFEIPEGQQLPSEGTYRVTCDLGPLGKFETSGPIAAGEVGLASKQYRKHLTLSYPKSAIPESQRLLDEKASLCADDLERLLTEAYGWYDAPAPTGFDLRVPLCSATAGGSSGRLFIFHINYLNNWDSRRTVGWEVPTHELGHSMHCVEPFHTFFDTSDKDVVGLYNESQATWIGSMGLIPIMGRKARDLRLMQDFPPILDYLKGSNPEEATNPKLRVFYVTWLLHNELGDEWTKRCFRIAHANPPGTRDRIRSQGWTPEEKMCALFTIAAGKDVTARFTQKGFQIRPSVAKDALQFAR